MTYFYLIKNIDSIKFRFCVRLYFSSLILLYGCYYFSLPSFVSLEMHIYVCGD